MHVAGTKMIVLMIRRFPWRQLKVDGLNIPSLKPGGKQLVNSSKILRISRRLKSASWSIEVLVDEQLSGLKLEAKHFLDYGLITFKFQRIENGNILVAEGVKAKKFIDMFLRMGWVVLFFFFSFSVFSKKAD
ncbi:Hypothetical predicted protein [Olea europaea subsp. europaea]|uniref:Uncharacterized protein n=1 Tax=Olea europaea subsp. europaea TaxID=158383 RepID=A0A8S0TDL1_OLEEU|nr:Hypothetical predicted protein [Olea europaea subsp. europaea]